MLTTASPARPARGTLRYYSFASWLFVLLGLLHNVVFVLRSSMNPAVRVQNPVIQSMEDYKIELFGTHTMLQFYEGFSLTMGCLFLLLGFMNVLVSRSLPLPALRSAALFNAFACLVLTALSLVYFHLLATSFLLLSLLGYALFYIMTRGRAARS
ncbi:MULTISPECIES: LIC_13387 family protein [Paenibacillus]|uniref:LIC_13387 family protein n=1 Tax=Paenibacillus TaxID=44249 RepID=UPI0022B8A03C|nr:hypothetical protein [Paenibacillus caseinilyticus]MCZ8519938.1 hypothetical protein [Paenibacillus caseinilyticus]